MPKRREWFGYQANAVHMRGYRRKPLKDPRRGHPPSLYFIADHDEEYIKIGCTTHVERRLMECQIGCPLRLKVFRLFPGTREDEQELHARFKADHVRGEWFRFSPTIRSWLTEQTPQHWAFMEQHYLRAG